MPCYKPLTGYRSRYVNASGKRAVVFKKEESATGVELQVPCGQCIGCRLERSRKWAMRIMHEASLHEENCFVTLTYSPENLPADGSLVKSHFQDFAKRLRWHRGKFRYFHCGEYGETFGRPHYHACLFGIGFPDRVLYSEREGVKLYHSAFLADCWSHGFCSVGDLTFESAAYCARYVLKKVTGEQAESHYMKLNDETGELTAVQPEYVTMSRRPGIGREWFEKFGSDVFPYDEVVINGAPCKPPRYYDGLYELSDPEGFARVKEEREKVRAARATENSGDYFEKVEGGGIRSRRGRLTVREKVTQERVKLLKRSYESGS